MAEWKPIDELFDFEKGSLQSSKCTPGKYTFVTAAEEWKTHESYTHDCEALIFAMAASGSLGRTHYIKGKFIASDLCFILTPKKGLRLDLTFYYRLFNFLRSDIVKKTAAGTSKLAINQTNFGAYKLLYFDHDHQLIFRDKIEKINSISESFSLGLEEQLSLLKQFRQAVLQEAIEGKLTADWRKKNPKLISGENHALKLLEKIKAEKEQLIKEGIIKKEKPLSPITDTEKPFDLPNGWTWCRLGDAGIFGRGKSKHRPRNDPSLFINGTIPFIQTGEVAQSKNHGFLIKKSDRFYNERGLAQSREWPTGTLCITIAANIAETGFLAIDACFPDSVVGFTSLSGKYTPWFIRHYLACIQEQIIKYAPATAQKNINLEIIGQLLFPLPPLSEQQAIVVRVDKLMSMIDELEKQVTERKDKSERLMQSVLREAFEGQHE